MLTAHTRALTHTFLAHTRAQVGGAEGDSSRLGLRSLLLRGAVGALVWLEFLSFLPGLLPHPGSRARSSVTGWPVCHKCPDFASGPGAPSGRDCAARAPLSCVELGPLPERRPPEPGAPASPRPRPRCPPSHQRYPWSSKTAAPRLAGPLSGRLQANSTHVDKSTLGQQKGLFEKAPEGP